MKRIAWIVGAAALVLTLLAGSAAVAGTATLNGSRSPLRMTQPACCRLMTLSLTLEPGEVREVSRAQPVECFTSSVGWGSEHLDPSDRCDGQKVWQRRSDIRQVL